MRVPLLTMGVCLAAAAGACGGGGIAASDGGDGTGGAADASGSGGSAAAGGSGGIGDTGGRAGGSGGAAGTGGRAGGTGGQGGGACAFASTYAIVDGGGLVAMLDTATLSPPNAFRYERQFFRQDDAGTLSCAPALPACNDPARVDVADVEAAIAHPDVQSALALAVRPIYGERAIADGPSFNFTRADGRGFSAGIACNVPSATCNPIPAGVSALAQVIRALITQALADPVCSQLR